MKTLLIAALAAAGLMTCACTSQTPTAPPAAVPAPSQPAVAHHHHPAGGTGAGTAQGGSGPASGSASTGGTGGTGGAGSAGTAQDTATTPPPCLSRYLGIRTGLSQGAAGSTYVVLVFKNLLSSPCTLYGYPGVSQAGGSPITQIGKAARENPSTARQLVTLAPHGKANALLQIVDAGVYPAARCGPVSSQWLQIYPPNQTVPLYLAYTSTACTKPVRVLTVNTVLPGSGG